MQAEFRRVYERIESIARGFGVRDVEALIAGQTEALTRFANNAIHQNMAELSRAVSVRVMIDNKTARASTNRFDEDSIRRTVEAAIALTRSVEADPELLPLYSPEAASAEVDRFHASTAEATPELRARQVGEAIRIVESAGQTAAGIFSTEHSTFGIYNSQGVSAFHSESMARFSITAMAEDSSGWAKATEVRLADLDPLGLARSASEKARLSAKPREIEPGAYTVILEPAAVLDLVGQMFGDFSGTAVSDERSFLTGRLGEPLFGANINVTDDAYHALQSGNPFDGEGVPRKRLSLIAGGVPKDLAYCRASAQKAGVAPTGHGYPVPNEVGEGPVNIVIAGGDTPVGEMVASTRRGVLVTRFWYIREVDPYEKMMTGMTRDGTFLIEDGQVVCGVKNFRFNQGLIEMLRNVEALSPSVRASGEEAFDMVVPGMKVNDFRFTEVTRF